MSTGNQGVSVSSGSQPKPNGGATNSNGVSSATNATKSANDALARSGMTGVVLAIAAALAL